MADAPIEAAGQAVAAAVGGCPDHKAVRYHDGELYVTVIGVLPGFQKCRP
jgi:hypothetical protein